MTAGYEATFTEINGSARGRPLCTMRIEQLPPLGVTVFLPEQGDKRWVVEDVWLDLTSDYHLPTPAEVWVTAA